MGYWLDVLACGGMVIAEIIGVLAIGMLIQGIVYWTTGFSIFNYVTKVL